MKYSTFVFHSFSGFTVGHLMIRGALQVSEGVLIIIAIIALSLAVYGKELFE